jgi:hypothetical protein
MDVELKVFTIWKDMNIFSSQYKPGTPENDKQFFQLLWAQSYLLFKHLKRTHTIV